MKNKANYIRKVVDAYHLKYKLEKCTDTPKEYVMKNTFIGLQYI